MKRVGGCFVGEGKGGPATQGHDDVCGGQPALVRLLLQVNEGQSAASAVGCILDEQWAGGGRGG